MRPERFRKAVEIRADVLVVDLEDAVAARDKQVARFQAFSAPSYLSTIDLVCAIRINGLDTRQA